MRTAIFRQYGTNGRVNDAAEIRSFEFNVETFAQLREEQKSEEYHLEAIVDDEGRLFDTLGNEV